MPGYFHIDKAVKNVKAIADNNRCITCDKLPGLRLRYSCGHTFCGECIEASDECLICFNSSNTSEPVIDLVQVQHAQNAFNLLTVFQETFNIDVYKRYRLSEKLKEEKEFFPECVQASITYYNKRKSSLNSVKENKENLTPLFIAGEQTSDLQSMKMNTRVSLVQKWLEKNENIQRPVRKPFKDINVNTSYTTSKENTALKQVRHVNRNRNSKINSNKSLNSKKNVTSAKQKKSSNNCLTSMLRQYDADKSLKKENKQERESELKFENVLNEKVLHQFINSNRDKESTIENLDTIVIEDTPAPEIDKDNEAWVAVLQSERKNLNNNKKTHSTDENLDFRTQINEIVSADSLNIRKNVLFYKKAVLYKSCQLCLSYCKNDKPEYKRLNSREVSITINTNSIMTSIKISKDEHRTKIKNSIFTQTDVINEEMNKNSSTIIPTAYKQNDILSQDLFVNDTILFEENKHCNQTIEDKNLRDIEKNKICDLPCPVVSDSDSDADMHCSGTLEVIAEVHTPSEKKYGVLTTVKNDSQRVKVGRRRTVDSNNSSEKENVEPNKMKRPRFGKKQVMKK